MNSFKKIIDLILKIFIISVSILGVIIILIIAFIIASIYLKPYNDFWNVKSNNFEELNILTEMQIWMDYFCIVEKFNQMPQIV